MQLQDRVDQINKLRESTRRLRQSMYATLEGGGFIEVIEQAGPQLDRVRRFVEAFIAPIPPLTVDDVVSSEFLSSPNPWILPMFPDLDNRPFHDPGEFEAATQLRAAHDALLEEATRSLATFETSFYDDVTQTGGKWYQGHATACGTLHEGKLGQNLPVLTSIVRELPGCCADELGTADCYYSVLESGASINAHTSSDNLKVRFHLGLSIPSGQCAISVGGQTNSWKQGEVLILEDAFLHTAWNRTDSQRIVALVDFWHPDLTLAERAALSAAFKRSEMRRMICYARSVPDDVTANMMRVFELEDSDASIADYWPRKPDFEFSPVGKITD